MTVTMARRPRQYRIPDPRARLMARVSYTAYGCWEWTGALNDSGYGLFSVHRDQTLAHRWSYRLWIGEIPSGLELDHRCRNRACVLPEHLEPVTRAQHCKRGLVGRNLVEANLRKTHCPYGHPYAGSNLYVRREGHRECRTCMRSQKRRRQERKRQ